MMVQRYTVWDYTQHAVMDQRVITIPMGLEAGARNKHGMGFRCRGVAWRSAEGKI